REDRRAALVAAVVGVAALLLELVGVAVGSDDLITRNVIAAWLPLALVVAIGLARPRFRLVGAAATAAICAAFVAAPVAVDADTGLQRPDWRGVNRALGVARERLVVFDHYRAEIPLLLYRPDLVRLFPGESAVVREVDFVAPDTPHSRYCWWGAACNLSSG